MKNRLFIIPLIVTLTLTACGPTTVVETPPTQENPDVIVETPATPDVVETKKETSGKLTVYDCVSDPDLAAILDANLSHAEYAEKINEYARTHTEPVEFTICDGKIPGVNKSLSGTSDEDEKLDIAWKPFAEAGKGHWDYSSIEVIKGTVVEISEGEEGYILLDPETSTCVKASFVPWAALNLDANDDFRPWFDKVDLDTSVKDEVFE